MVDFINTLTANGMSIKTIAMIFGAIVLTLASVGAIIRGKGNSRGEEFSLWDHVIKRYLYLWVADALYVATIAGIGLQYASRFIELALKSIFPQ